MDSSRFVFPAPFSPMMATPTGGKTCSSSVKLRNWRRRSSRNPSMDGASLIVPAKYTYARARARWRRACRPSLAAELRTSFFQESGHALTHVAGRCEQTEQIRLQPQRVLGGRVVGVVNGL